MSGHHARAAAEHMTDEPDARLSTPAVLRNRGPVLDILRNVRLMQCVILQVASDSGEHINYLAQRLPALDWQPFDPSPASRVSIAA